MLRKVLLFFVITKTQPPQPAQTRIRITTRRRLSTDAFIHFNTQMLFFCFSENYINNSQLIRVKSINNKYTAK